MFALVAKSNFIYNIVDDELKARFWKSEASEHAPHYNA